MVDGCGVAIEVGAVGDRFAVDAVAASDDGADDDDDDDVALAALAAVSFIPWIGCPYS